MEVKATTVDPAKHIMQFFAYAHLPPHLQAASRPFCELAEGLTDVAPLHDCGLSAYELVTSLRGVLPELLPDNIERHVASSKLDGAAHACAEHYPLEDVLRYVLEAKDCAVRAVLAK